MTPQENEQFERVIAARDRAQAANERYLAQTTQAIRERDEAVALLRAVEAELSHDTDCPYRHGGHCECLRVRLVYFLSRLDRKAGAR